MANPNYAGRTFKIEGRKLTLEGGVWGYSDGPVWVLCADFLGGGDLIVSQVDPEPIKVKLEQMIKSDIAAGREEMIAYVGINKIVALSMWMADVITRDHFEKAEEGDGYIELTNVLLCDKPRKVRILFTPQYTIETYDQEGEIVKVR